MPELWHHIQWSTFGAWLPGDPRGFRNHQHRIHSQGNYKAPPPSGEHRGLLEYSKRVMHKPAVTLDPKTRSLARDAIIKISGAKMIHLRCCAVSSNHVHALLRIDPEHLTVAIGALKRSSSHAIRDRFPGRVWGGRKNIESVRDQEYSANVERYILAHHRKENASTWHDRMGGADALE